MALLPQPFNAGENAPQPTEIGIESVAGAARRVGQFFNQSGLATERFGERAGQDIGGAIRDAGQQAVAGIEHAEISHGAATFAALTDSLTNDWNDRVKTADPNDQSIAGQFRAQAEQQLDKFREAFNTDAGQKWAEAHIDALRQHLFEKTSADMSTLAGQAVRVNAQNAVNTLSNTVEKDPTALDFALKSLDTSVEGMVSSSPNLKGPAAAQVRMEVSERAREQVVKSAAVGYIEKTGQVPPWATDPKYSKYINGVELRQFQRAALAQQKSNAYFDKQTKLLAKQEADLAVSRGINQVFTDSVSIDPATNQVRIAPDAYQKVLDIVRKNPDAPTAAAHARTALDWFERQQAPKPVATDPIRKQALVDGMWDPARPTMDIDIYKAEVDGELSRQDAAPLLALNKTLREAPLRDPVWRDTMAAVKAKLIVAIPGVQGRDTVGMGNYAKFAQTFVPMYIAAKTANTLESNALDVNNPNSMISKAMAPFLGRTMEQRISDYTAQLGVVDERGVPTGVPGMPPRPPALANVAGLQWNPARKQWRDGAGKVYDAAGREVQ